MTEKEPTFRIEIRACHYDKLSMEQLTVKLQLMHKLNLTKYYTIIEDTDSVPEIPREKAKIFVP
jgi:hypothetical protein